MAKMNSMKIPGQQTLDLKRSASNTVPQIPTGNKHLNSKKIPFDIQHMRSKTCPTSTCLSICIIHIDIIKSH